MSVTVVPINVPVGVPGVEGRSAKACVVTPKSVSTNTPVLMDLCVNVVRFIGVVRIDGDYQNHWWHVQCDKSLAA